MVGVSEENVVEHVEGTSEPPRARLGERRHDPLQSD
jgi:hypothetical protein